MPHYPTEIEYSEKYQDDEFEYRHVMLPKEIFKSIPRGRLLSERMEKHRCATEQRLATL